MCEPLRIMAVSPGKGFCDSVSDRLVFGDKLSQQITVQPLVSRDSLQTTRDVHTLNLGEDQFTSLARGPRRYARFFPALRSGPARKGSEECSGINWLCHMVIHARFQAALDLLGHGMSGHGDDREVSEAGFSSQQLCCS